MEALHKIVELQLLQAKLLGWAVSLLAAIAFLLVLLLACQWRRRG